MSFTPHRREKAKREREGEKNGEKKVYRGRERMEGGSDRTVNKNWKGENSLCSESSFSQEQKERERKKKEEREKERSGRDSSERVSCLS